MLAIVLSGGGALLKNLDYVISKLITGKLKNVRTPDLTILRMGIYQIAKMSSVPEYAAVDESVQLAKKYARGRDKFINGVLRSYIRDRYNITLPDREKELVKYLSVKYSYEEWIIKLWMEEFDAEFTESLLATGNQTPPLTIRTNTGKISRDELIAELKKEGYRLIATGEMGIGNTTTSSAILSVLLNRPVVDMTGRGAGLSTDGLHRKIAAIEKAIQTNHPNPEDPMDVLHKIGGLDIAGLVGVFLGGALENIPIVIDGVISAAAAFTAMKFCPTAADYWIAAHVSKEPAGKIVLDALGKKPMLTCEMCLGEGTGAVAAFPILDVANAVYTEMSTFSQIDMDNYEPLD